MTTLPRFPTKQSGRILALLFAILFVGVLDNQVILPILSLIASVLRRSVTEMGWVITGYAFAAALQNLLFGPLSDYFGRKPILLFGLGGFALSAYVLSIATAFSLFFALRTLMGVFAGILSTCVTAYVGDYFPYAVRGRAMGTVLASYFAALVVGVPLGAVVADRWDWHWIFRATSLLASLLIVLAVLILPRLRVTTESPRNSSQRTTKDIQKAGPPGAPSAVRHKSPPESTLLPFEIIRENVGEHFHRYRDYLSSQEKLAALISAAFVSGATLALLAFVSPWLVQVFGLSESKVGMVFLLVGAASMLASPLSGWLSDLIGKRRLFLLSSFATAFLVVFLPSARGLGWLLALFFAVALAIAFRQTSQQTLVTELTPTRGRGSFVALRNCFSQVGIGVSVFLASLLYAKYGFAAVVILSSLESILAACCFFLVREPALASSTVHE
ncbi:MAG TPA: MFS transporter [Acidobacteriota bacterium]|jgi:predicted MFS family arabinose efflux permease|nr:MFS transporter [Acidobacteriota bacterium]